MKQRETITKLRQTNEFHISTKMINFIAPYGNKNKFKFISQVIVFHMKHFPSYRNILGYRNIDEYDIDDIYDIEISRKVKQYLR